MKAFATKLAVLILFSAAGIPAGGEIRPLREPIHWAARYGETRIAKLLIERGARVNVQDHFGNTALHLAVRHPEMVKLLLDNGALVNARNAFGNTPLHLAVENREVVELLLAAGADASLKNVFERTALDYSLAGGRSPYNLSISELLIKAE